MPPGRALAGTMNGDAGFKMDHRGWLVVIGGRGRDRGPRERGYVVRRAQGRDPDT